MSSATTAGDRAPEALPQVLSLLDFLADYDAQRNPLLLDIAKEGLFRLEEPNLPGVPGVAVTAGGEGAWLTVDYVELPAAPRPDEEVAAVMVGALTPDVRPELLPAPPTPDELLALAEGDPDPGTARDPEQTAGGQTGPDADADDQEAAELLRTRLEAAERWIEDVWASWAAAYADARAAKKLYRQVFETRERLALDRDSVELVWGFGPLSWTPEPGLKIRHPLLTIPVEVAIDERTQQLRVHPDGALELQTLPFAGIELRDRAGLLSKRETLAELELEPWSPEILDHLREAARHVHEHGALRGSADHPAGAPVVDPEWVLYLRRRQRNYQGFLDQLRATYKAGAAVPDALSTLVLDPSRVAEPGSQGPEGADAPDRSGAADGGPGVAERLLLPLPANEEQIQILRLAQQAAGVTVQGPPGTGKTHTIANLVSHYVAQGQRVLVVAEKEQALRRVAEKVPQEIRALIVNVFGGDADSRRELDASIRGIQTGVAGLDRGLADREIARLTGELDTVDRAVGATTAKMFRARAAETTPLPGQWSAGNEPTPQKAAAWLAAHPDFGYVPDRLTPDIACPLTVDELVRLLELIDTVGMQRAQASAFTLPALSDLPTAPDLAALFARHAQLVEQLEAGASALTTWAFVDDADDAQIERAKALLTSQQDLLAAAAHGWLAQVAVQLGDPLLRPHWQQFHDTAARHREQIITLRSPLAAHDIAVPDSPDPKLVTQLGEARATLAAKGKLGMFAGAARAALAACTVDGHTPTTADEVGLCEQALALAAARRTLSTLWRNQLGPVGGPELPATAAPEVSCGAPLALLAGLLAADAGWARLLAALAELGVSAPAQASSAAALRAAQVLELIPARRAERDLAGRLDQLTVALESAIAAPDASPLASELLDAARAGATERYARTREQVADLATVAPQARELRDLHARLRVAAPIWAASLLSDRSAAGNPADLAAAWQWRQLDTWVRQLSSGPTPAQLQKELDELADERRRTITDLVARSAWRRLADNLGGREEAALNDYLQAVSKFGKGYSKFSARWVSEMRRALDEAKDAVPVWVMTTQRALDSFRPGQKPPFDVLIVDEASQAGFQALPLFGLAERAIIVGDEKQTSPLNVGLSLAPVFDLLDDHLQGIHGYRTLFDPNNSLYDMAKLRFRDRVMLVEHFRCLPQIIAFSSALCYNNAIEPLRDQPPLPDWVPLGAIKVLDGYRSGTGKARDLNRPEAHAVVALIAELDADPRYEGMSFGVVTLLAGGQARLIDDLLVEHLGPKRYRDRNLRVGDAGDFQGDERDVMVISVVAATDPATPTGRVAAMTDRPSEQRINVAASRAQQQMWVVHSLDPEQFSDGDYRAQLIRHCRDPRALQQAGADALSLAESDFETQVLQRILNRGYRRIRAQYPVGSPTRSYRIDLVVEGPTSRLAVECDGERWHGPERWHADRARQQVLERAGWTFERIRGSAFYRDPDSALEPLWARLEQMGIPTGDAWFTGDGSRPTVREVYGVDSSTSTIAGTTSDATTEEAPTDPTPTRAASDLLAPRLSEQLTPAPNSATAVSSGPVPAPRPALDLQRRTPLVADVCAVWRSDNPAELDLLALLLDSGGRVRSDEDLVFYNNPIAAGGAVSLTRTSTQAPDGTYQQTGRLLLDELGSDIASIVLVIAADQTPLQAIPGLAVTVQLGGERIEQPITSDSATRAAAVLELRRRRHGWTAAGLPGSAHLTPTDILRSYGVSVEETD